MHTLLHLSGWSIGEGFSCEESGSLSLQFSQSEIASLVRVLKDDYPTMSILRRYLWQEGETVHRLSDDQVLERICLMFSTGRLHACGRRPERHVVDADAKEETEDKPPERRPPELTEKTWVGIELVDDTGRPVPGEKYRVLLTDGSTREGTLDAQGRVRFDEIDSGICDVTFPNLDAGEWKAA